MDNLIACLKVEGGYDLELFSNYIGNSIDPDEEQMDGDALLD